MKEFWEREIGLVGKMLARDSRNFHGWSYRRLVVAELEKLGTLESTCEGQGSSQEGVSSDQGDLQPSMTTQEFEYTNKMLRNNLSNFSAWHNRSKLIPRLIDERRLGPDHRRKLYEDEMAKVGEALSIDPYDQSLWYYYQFLTTEMWNGPEGCFRVFTEAECRGYLNKEVETLRELLDDFDDCKWIPQYLIEHSVTLGSSGSNERLSEEDLRKWLDLLHKLDPLRKRRWDDLADRVTNLFQ